MKVTYIGHACIMMESGGTRILMDPWLTDPTYHGTWWHYPPLALGVRDLPSSTTSTSRTSIPTTSIRRRCASSTRTSTSSSPTSSASAFATAWRRSAFGASPSSTSDRTSAATAAGSTVRLIPPDRPWDDSAILVKDGTTTVLNVNDCHLDEATLDGLGKEQQIDLAFLTFTGASQYPGLLRVSAGVEDRALAGVEGVAPRGVRQLGAAAAHQARRAGGRATSRCWRRISSS